MLWKVTRVKNVAEIVENSWGNGDAADPIVLAFPFSVPLFFLHIFMMIVAARC
jgi:uncharacterized membrane protein